MSSPTGDSVSTIDSNDIDEIVNRIFDASNAPRVVKKYTLNSASSSSSEVDGFLGSHYNLEITVQSSGTEEDTVLRLHAKLMPDNEYQRHFITSQGIFAKEVDFYSKIAPCLGKRYGGEKWMPTCYLAKADRLVMENLRLQGYRVRGSFFDSLPHVKSALAAVARLHACSLLAEADASSARSTASSQLQPLRGGQPTLKDAHPDSFREVAFKRAGQSNEWLRSTFELICAVGERRLGLEPVGLRRVLERAYQLVEASDVHRNVVCHGDLWTKNVMFDDDAGPLPKCLLVDFQLVRYAPPALDVLMLLYLHTSRALRREHEDDLVRYYHEALEESAQCGGATTPVPSFGEVKEALEELRLFGPIVAATYLPINLMDQQELKNCADSPEGFEKLMLGDKIGSTLAYMEKNESYRKKIEEVIEELGKYIDAGAALRSK